MRFVDEVEIITKGGNGGNGHVSFLHTHLNNKSGPDGGDGGMGGNVYLNGDEKLNSFHKIFPQKKWIAQTGFNGGKNLKSGKKGSDIFINVPLGTSVFIIRKDYENENNKEYFCDVLKENEKILIAKGGKGGFGNKHFATSTNRTPYYAEEGEKTFEIYIYLELKIIADIGLLGLPSSGKSTLLNSLTNANVKTADFDFTTLQPQLGVFEGKLNSKIIIADLPGIIKGASKNKGLGFKFLKHISRCKILFYVVDSNSKNPLFDLELLREELSLVKNNNLFTKKFLWDEKKQIIIWNKTDLFSQKKLEIFKSKILNFFQYETNFFVSALMDFNIIELKKKINDIVDNNEISRNNIENNEECINRKNYKVHNFFKIFDDIKIEKLRKSYWKISGLYFEKIIEENKENYDKLQKAIFDSFKKPFVEKKIIEAGVKKNDTIMINNKEYLLL